MPLESYSYLFKTDDSQESEGTTRIGSLYDLGVGVVESGLARPYNATVGLLLPQVDLTHSYDHRSIAGQVGEFGGTLLDIVILSKLSTNGVGRGIAWGAERGLISGSMARSRSLAGTLSMGTTGALYGGAFTPGSLSTRLKNAAIGSATFATLGASTAGLGSFSFLGQAGSRTLLQNMALGGLSGMPAGVVNAEVTSLVNGRGFTLNPYTLGSSAMYYGAFGAAMGGVTHGLEGIGRSRSASALETSTRGREQTVRPVSEELPPTSSAPSTTPRTTSFDIPKAGNVELGKLMRETPLADQIRLVQEVVASRPQVPVGSWMRMIATEDMPQFLRAIDAMYPKTALENANFLVETRNLRPPTPDSPPIDFNAWRQAIDLVSKAK